MTAAGTGLARPVPCPVPPGTRLVLAAGARLARPVPPGTRLVLAAGTRRPRPGVLTGGSPWRRLTLSAAGDRLVDAWSAGVAVGGAPAEQRLAGHLVDAGLATPLPGNERPAVTVVVPVRDRAGGLADTL
ncbi:MAG: hypothetical protein ACYCUG_12480, partial [Acidimicrobiales bacterium]